ncbi:MAG: Ribosomal large subunit pseudouridine synthase B [candidate division WS2 bacterium ADurb.Bin280]|uniref:Pseudouridine synthase n=1 Tax=candidate division WS2 bacterium ADurb.Bin280 TaxID=1852829 RepID=A0A1V5SFR1_9BACT|nr:MAG: Ribosomal large subunit pseudouridine synthase B [candidate division WS2 bacterium ADurb.Bin280]
MRINKYLATCGLGSRRGVEQIVLSGKVSVNGKVTTDLSTKISDKDVVCVDQKPIRPDLFFKYFLVYKPVGYVCTNADDHARKKIIDLDERLQNLSIVGRLDKESEGLVIMTNDGDFCQEYQHPLGGHEKEYIVEGCVISKDESESECLERLLRFFKCGCLLDGYKTKKAKIKVMAKRGSRLIFNIILKEGRNRQIRRMFSKAGLEVVALKRIRIAEAKLNNMLPGDLVAVEKDFFTSVDKV